MLINAFNQVFNSLLLWYSAATAWAPASARLALLSAAAGIGMIWVFGKVSNQARIRTAKRKVQAHLLELRIFSDEPAVSWRAQRSLLRANLGYAGLMLRPVLVLALPTVLLLVHLEGFYGRAPLPVGRPAIVTVAMRGPAVTAPVLMAPEGIEIETPPVRVLNRNEVSWRIRPVAPVSGYLHFTIDGRTVSKRIEAGGAPLFVPGRRVASAYAALWRPGEPRIGAGRIAWIDIQYPEASVSLFGFSTDWLVWFFILSMASALLLKGRFKVSV
ncbi:MAG: hypothetical protein ACM3S5_16220 [Rhodospirillales bacterium]